MLDDHLLTLLNGDTLSGEWFMPESDRAVAGSLAIVNGMLQLSTVGTFVRPGPLPATILKPYYFTTIFGRLGNALVTLSDCVGWHEFITASDSQPGLYRCKAVIVGHHAETGEAVVRSGHFSTNSLPYLFPPGYEYSLVDGEAMARSAEPIAIRTRIGSESDGATVSLRADQYTQLGSDSIRIGARHTVRIRNTKPQRFDEFLGMVESVHSLVSVFLCSFDPMTELSVRFVDARVTCQCLISGRKFEPYSPALGRRYTLQLADKSRFSTAIAEWGKMFDGRKYLRDLFETAMRPSDIAMNTRTVLLIQFLEWLAGDAVPKNKLIDRKKFNKLRKELESHVELIFAGSEELQKRIMGSLPRTNEPNLRDKLANLVELLREHGVQFLGAERGGRWTIADHILSAFRLRNNVSHGSDPKEGRDGLPPDSDVSAFIRFLATASILYKLGCTAQECEQGASIMPNGWRRSS